MFKQNLKLSVQDHFEIPVADTEELKDALNLLG